MSLWNNEYGEAAGKGAKARQRQRLDTPKKTGRRKPYLQKPEFEKRKAKQHRMSEAYTSAVGIKAKVRMLVVDRDIGFLELMETLKRQGVPLSGVTAGNLRAEMREVMKLLESVGLLNIDALARRRKKIKAGEAA